MNAPERSALWILPEGTKKCVMTKDNKIQNAAMFTLNKEDHTLGNPLRHQLLRNDHVRFAGYKLPHPLEQVCLVSVQTDSDDYSPLDAMIQATNNIHLELDELSNRFSAAVSKFRKEQEERGEF